MSLHEKRIEALKFVIEVLEIRKLEAHSGCAIQRRIDVLTRMLWDEEEKAAVYKTEQGMLDSGTSLVHFLHTFCTLGWYNLDS